MALSARTDPRDKSRGAKALTPLVPRCPSPNNYLGEGRTRASVPLRFTRLKPIWHHTELPHKRKPPDAHC